MLTEFLLYEVGTTVGGLFGLKLLRAKNLNSRMQSIRRTKKIPIVNNMLREKLGTISKTEQWLSIRVIRKIRIALRYQEFRLLLLLLYRMFYRRIGASRNNNVRLAPARRRHYRAIAYGKGCYSPVFEEKTPA
jgi:hypothetical protein